MFCFFWGLQTFVHPRWRAQWNFFERSGYPNYMPLMCLIHLPSFFCPFLDIASKDARLLAVNCPSRTALLAVVTLYHVCYELWLGTNWFMCGGAIPCVPRTPSKWDCDPSRLCRTTSLLSTRLSRAAAADPWYYDIQLSPHPVASMIAYLLGVNVMLSGLVLLFRRYVLWWVSTFAAPRVAP
jgi:hypothetical protein